LNLLLDTHIVLWWLSDDPRLPTTARDEIADPDNTVFVSAATLWEAAIKASLGRLEVADDLPAEIAAEDFELMDISPEHAWRAGLLPPHHQDPFDRMLSAQALLQDLTLVSVDGIFGSYGVKLLPL